MGRAWVFLLTVFMAGCVGGGGHVTLYLENASQSPLDYVVRADDMRVGQGTLAPHQFGERVADWNTTRARSILVLEVYDRQDSSTIEVRGRTHVIAISTSERTRWDTMHMEHPPAFG